MFLGNSGRLKLLLILSLIALLGDFTYEGARSVSGAYLAFLEAPILSVGVLGFGEVLMYSFRGVAGTILVKKPSQKLVLASYVLGYVLNLAVIPMLALTSRWSLALMLYLLERVGKGIRGPARDSLVSKASEKLGLGKGFGLYEVLDQAGAVLGPLTISLGISSYGLRKSFLLLTPTAIFAIILASYIAVKLYRYSFVERKFSGEKFSLGIESRYFLTYTAMLMMGLVQWCIISYYLECNRGFDAAFISVLYMIAMLSDGLLAIPLGVLFDKYRFRILLVTPLLASSSSIILLSSSPRIAIFIACILYGFILSCTETVLKASIPFIFGRNVVRGYGLLSVVQASAWGVGALLISVLYYECLRLIPVFIILTEALSFIFCLKLVFTKASSSGN